MGKFVITQRKNQEFQFILKAGNGEAILTSEGYTTKSSSNNGIESVRTNAQQDARFERKKSSNSKHYFVLKAANGQVIGTSEMYETEQGMERGIDSVRKNAPHATLEDQTV